MPQNNYSSLRVYSKKHSCFFSRSLKNFAGKKIYYSPILFKPTPKPKKGRPLGAKNKPILMTINVFKEFKKVR